MAHRSQFHEWVSAREPALVLGRETRRIARDIMQKTRGVVVSSTIALSTAIVAMRASGDFGTESTEVSLLQAVLRYSEQYQVPPASVMQLIASEEDEQPRKRD